MHRCSKCDTDLPDEAFRIRPSGKIDCWCRACRVEYNRKWREAHPTYHRQHSAKWKENHPERHREYMRKYQREWMKRWRLEHEDEYKEINREAHARRYSSANYQVRCKISAKVNRAIRVGHSASLERILGYSPADLRAHLESLFDSGMSWENYGKNGWHIDHVVPVSYFSFESEQDGDVRECWALENLQPMWASDNCSKYNTLPDGSHPPK